MTILDAHTVAPQAQIEADVCIVGAGAAGLAVARELIGSRYRVVVLESGGLQGDAATQALYDVDTVGHPLRVEQGYVSLNRYFGGSTNTWGGRCIPLNAIDFAARDWVNDSGWPFERQVLEPFYQQAAQVLQLPDYGYFSPDRWRSRLLGPLVQALYSDEGIVPELALLGRSPIKMGRAYRRQLAAAPNLSIYLKANVTELEPNPTGTAVEGLQVATLGGHRFRVQARVYVLACGGWENARLLLDSSRHCAQGLGNPYDVVGRYYMEHPKILLGRIYPRADLLRSPAVLDYSPIAGGYGQMGLRLSNTQQRQARVLNHYLQLMPGFPAGLPEARQTWQWVCSRAKRLRFDQIRRADLGQVAPHLGQIGEYWLCRRLNRPVPYPYIDVFNHMEHAPNRDSRVSLSRDRDALGGHRLQVDLRVTTQEKESLLELHRLVGRQLQRLGLGELVTPELDPTADWPHLTDASHHMGTTRMGLHPRRSVVDPDGLVHGLGNLYITGSSVFPTGGHANPTLTLVALALRLAHHLQTAVLPKAARTELASAMAEQPILSPTRSTPPPPFP
ncbi:FAD-dependent oxidoreductase [Nodosilinea sp. PGN35]|uniref:FAD-dependent oxidoreductase n=1 Tax=Nodosilinea sp. PGN35 TaxID=3020489 RepID=UPI0023B21CFF|nr:FAD-dependent oxidoreductase [Nodosilinea sp. TSF1-S3]MDF0367091.1 FAD-dependent oxidoreductase [Nodosilinea sp. TSF1-S3]